MKLKYFAIGLAFLSILCHAEIGDESEIGLYAIDCEMLDKGAISIIPYQIILAANGRTLELLNPNDDMTVGYFGRTIPPEGFIKVIDAEIDPKRSVGFEIFEDKKGRYVQISTGHNAITMKVSPAFFSGYMKFRVCQ